MSGIMSSGARMAALAASLMGAGASMGEAEQSFRQLGTALNRAEPVMRSFKTKGRRGAAARFKASLARRNRCPK